MSERKQLTASDWIGIGLFAVGVTGVVLMSMALSTAAPLGTSGPSGRVAAVWVGLFGLYPSLAWNSAIAFLGGRLFLQGAWAGFWRNVLGVTGVALALSIVLGAISPTAGGEVGLHTGAVVTDATHFALGILVGFLSIFAVAWFVWLRPGAASPTAASAPVAPNPTAATLRAQAKPAVKPLAERTAVSKLGAAGEGVTAAESAALFPDEPAIPVASVPHADPSPRKQTTATPIPPSPYPDDVRRKGQIPAGAKPLETEHAAPERPSDLPAPNVYRWTAPRAEVSSEPSGADLAPTDVPLGGAALAEARGSIEDEVSPRARPAGPAASPLVTPLDDAAPLAPVPTPSWETPELFAEPEEEPAVDAYGTPLTLVEKLREARRAGGLDHQPAAGGHQPAAAGDQPPAAGPAPAAAVPVLAEIAEFEDLAEIEADERAPIAPDVQPVRGLLAAEVDDELHALEEPDDDLAGELDAEFDAEVAEEHGLALEVDAGAPAGLEDEPQAAVEPSAEPVAAEKVQHGLFDAIESTSKPATAEREVVLQPAPAPAPAPRVERAPAAATPQDERHKLLTEVGCLFVERGRVAVSMLQRQYAMDFDDACKVLDELQEMGLIGPYLGGQRRDILLTREQWLERVAKSGVAL